MRMMNKFRYVIFIKDGVLADIESIHRMTIDKAVEKKTNNIII